MTIIKIIKKLHRKIQLSLLVNTNPEDLKKLGEKKLLKLFRKSQNASFAVQNIMKNAKIDIDSIHTIEDFKALNFTMSKQNTFNQYSLEELCRKNSLNNLMNVLTSSGHSGNFAYGLTTWQQGKTTPDLIDLALEAAFQIDEKKTLLVNCLPMGVRFLSNVVTQAEVSVREDMALTLIKKFSPYYDQIIIACDPLFLKLLMDQSTKWQVDWSKIHKHLIIGEETFGENYRNYIGEMLNINPDDPTTGLIGSSMGVGELGLNLCFESLETIALRRSISHHPTLMKKLFGCMTENDPLPMLFSYNPLSTYLEIAESDAQGYGELLVSILDKKCVIPMFRYKTGDDARLLSSDDIKTAFHAEGLPSPILPQMPMICVRGRDKDRLSTGLHIGVVKDALYHNKDFAHKITGAFRVNHNEPDVLHIQLRRDIQKTTLNVPDVSVSGHILFASCKVHLWNYDEFPYGQSIDYERKFTYLA